MAKSLGVGRRYARVLADYVERFHDVPPSILSEEAALNLMRDVLRRDHPEPDHNSTSGLRTDARAPMIWRTEDGARSRDELTVAAPPG